MIYAMSDIHGCIEELEKKMELVDLSGNNRIIFLGDYIDYGDSSCQVLQYIWQLQKRYGDKKVVVLKGNHEQMFQEWIDDYRNPFSDGTEDLITFNDLWKRYGIDFIKSNKHCICEDKLFYSFLRNRKNGNDKEYEFPLKGGGIVIGKVDIYNPFVEVKYQGEKKSVVDPKWHILIANYAYIDAAFNYQNDIKELAGWTDRKPIKRRFSNNVINVWMDENNINP